MLLTGWLARITLLLPMTMVTLPTSTMSSECIGCPEDCSKVLVAPARVVTIKEPEIVKPSPEAVKVTAVVEGDEMTSAVKCTVETENDVDTITCGW